MPPDPLIRQGLAEEIVGAYRALAQLHRAAADHISDGDESDGDETALHEDQADRLDRDAALWCLRFKKAAQRATA